jgi:predicted transcriptional regulator
MNNPAKLKPKSQELPLNERFNFPAIFRCKSGLDVDFNNPIWKVLPNISKGHEIKVGWVNSSSIPEEDIAIIYSVILDYAINNSAGTAATLNMNIKSYVLNGIPSLPTLITLWSSLRIGHKKSLNQFFLRAIKLGHQHLAAHQKFTNKNLPKEKSDPFNINKGRLNGFEYQDFTKKINLEISNINWKQHGDELDFFTKDTNMSYTGFSYMTKMICLKTSAHIIRRPLQIAMIKWSDLIPVGASYSDPNIITEDEIKSTGQSSLQIRIYRIKEKIKESIYRSYPEKFPIALSEDFSDLLYQYKRLYAEGVLFILKRSNIKINKIKVINLMLHMPIFPSHKMFEIRVSTIEEFKAFFSQHSALFHASETWTGNTISNFKIQSNRIKKPKISSTRLRHTALTRGAEQGLHANQLATLTGVTTPAVRHYIDMDYSARRLIDKNYIANEFLKKAFNTPVEEVLKGDTLILDGNFDAVGGARNKANCSSCNSRLGKPLGCYGCQNFRPVLEGDHRTVLREAEIKLHVNQQQLQSPNNIHSIEILHVQIEMVKTTIDICNEVLEKGHNLDAK